MGDEDVKEVARGVVLHFFQEWGQEPEKRLAALNAAFEAAGYGVKAELFWDRSKSGYAVKGPDSDELTRAKGFLDELHKCWPLGQFEKEEAAVVELIERHAEENKRRT